MGSACFWPSGCPSHERLLVLIGTGIHASDQRDDRKDDEGHDADDGAEVVVLLFVAFGFYLIKKSKKYRR